MGTYKNPALFIMQHDIPFNFDMGWEEHDRMYHDEEQRQKWPELMPSVDPCQMSDEEKAAHNAQRDEWVRMYRVWCDAD